ncbi:MAG: ChaN family lipoprotein [Gammaproteobacteria bacterium]|nr:ChaN family lipoprotein [Gammaproteobacteria bacterium]
MQILVRQFVSVSSMLACLLLAPAANAEQCFEENSWVSPERSEYVSETDVFNKLTDAKMIFLGEHHTNESHHLWHAELLERLLQNGNWAIGLEAFPRSSQALLDRWIRGDIDEANLRKNTNWDAVWSFPFDYYLPVLYLAQRYKSPLIALNVERELVRATRVDGWKNVPQNQREGVDDPEIPGKDYLQKLAASFQRHNTQAIGPEQKQQFQRFVEQQLLWDRAMARAVGDYRKTHPTVNILSIVGSWHLIDFHGVPFQLNSLGYSDATVLIPWDNHLNCSDLNKNFSTYIYTPSQ